MKVNTEIIEKLKPCKDRFDNWLNHYKNFSGDVLEFLALNKISATDKIWVTLGLLRDDNDLFTIQVFAIDCAFAAYAYTATYAVTATTAAADAAADAAAASADYAYADYAAASADYAYADYAAASADYAYAAASAAYAYAAASAAYAAASADYAYADYAASAAAELERQVDALAWLIKNRGEK